jgi:hypothetical protein
VRGNLVPGVSDLNIVLVLEESTPEAHAAIAESIRVPSSIEPLVLGRDGIERNIRAFGLKFSSIRRNYRVLHGADLLKDLTIDIALERFLVEQSLRNFSLRLVHAFIKRSERGRRYESYLVSVAMPLIVALSEVLRLDGVTVPRDPAERVPYISRHFDISPDVLDDLLALRRSPRKLSREEKASFHARLLRLVRSALQWIESRWPPPTP